MTDEQGYSNFRYCTFKKQRGTNVMKTITLSWLRRQGACGEAFSRFREVFGNEASVREVIVALHEEGKDTWEAWLLVRDRKLTRSMIENGANVHATDDYAIHNATVKTDNIRIVELLVDAGADVHSADDYAIRYAAYYGHRKIVEFLIKKGANVHAGNDFALRFAAHNGYIRIVKLLVDAGADISANDYEAIRWADNFGDREMARFLRTAASAS